MFHLLLQLLAGTVAARLQNDKFNISRTKLLPMETEVKA